MKKTKTIDLQQKVDDLEEELAAERAKTRQFGTVLGQLRFRVTEVLKLDPKTRAEVLREIDAVFRRAL
jgi:hypothetical protein